MRLNPDCIRDVLLTVEEKSTGHSFVALPDPSVERLQKYDVNEITYHVQQCDLSGLLYKTKQDLLGNYSILDLSPAGHEFLANIRKDTLWVGVKEVAKSVGSTSLKAITQIASNVVSEIIKAQFGLNA